MPVRFRSAPPRLADIPAITRIYAHAVTHGTASFELEPPDEAEMARADAARCSTAAFPTSSAEIGGALLGYAYAGPYRTRPAYRFTRRGFDLRRPAARSAAASAARCSTA